MGVKRLSSFILQKKLARTYDSIKKFVDINTKNKNSNVDNCNKMYVLAVDVWLFAHKFQYSKGNVLVEFLNLMIKLLSNNILPIPVFDGKPPIEKKDVINQRSAKKIKLKQKILVLEQKLENNEDNEITYQIKQLNKQIIYISKYDIHDLKYLFNLMNIPYLDANGEADYMCAKLYKDKKIDGCLSDDMDILAHGCYKLIKISGRKVIEFNLYYVLKQLNIEYLQFVDMCILFGCDYVKTIPKIEPELSYSLIKAYKNLENIKDNFMVEDNEKHKKFIDNYKNARKIFLTASNKEIIPSDFVCHIDEEIDIDPVIKFIKYKCNNLITEDDIYKFKKNIKKINILISNKVFCKSNNIDDIHRKYYSN